MANGDDWASYHQLDTVMPVCSLLTGHEALVPRYIHAFIYWSLAKKYGLKVAPHSHNIQVICVTLPEDDS